MPERDNEFNEMDDKEAQAIFTLDYMARVWSKLTEEQKTARGKKARDEMIERLKEGRN